MIEEADARTKHSIIINAYPSTQITSTELTNIFYDNLSFLSTKPSRYTQTLNFTLFDKVQFIAEQDFEIMLNTICESGTKTNNGELPTYNLDFNRVNDILNSSYNTNLKYDLLNKSHEKQK